MGMAQLNTDRSSVEGSIENVDDDHGIDWNDPCMCDQHSRAC